MGLQSTSRRHRWAYKVLRQAFWWLQTAFWRLQSVSPDSRRRLPAFPKPEPVFGGPHQGPRGPEPGLRSNALLSVETKRLEARAPLIMSYYWRFDFYFSPSCSSSSSRPILSHLLPLLPFSLLLLLLHYLFPLFLPLPLSLLLLPPISLLFFSGRKRLCGFSILAYFLPSFALTPVRRLYEKMFFVFRSVGLLVHLWRF